MINKIIDGISASLYEEFGDDHEIYTEPVNQGLSDRSFSIICLNPRIEQKLGKRYFRENQFCIHYFGTSSEDNMSVINRLFDCLELITVDGDLVRGTSMTAETSDGVVSFIVNYNMFVCRPSEQMDSMESFGVSTDVKG